MLWIKEVELVDSLDDLKYLCSVRGIRMPNFEVLDAEIASALNKIAWNDLPKVILTSVTSVLHYLRIGLRMRQNGKSDVPVKQRGGWKEKNKSAFFSPSEINS